MAASYRYLRQVTRSSLLEYSFRNILSARLTFASEITTCTITDYIKVPCRRARGDQNWLLRNFSHGSVKLVTLGGTPRFEIQEIDPPKREKWKTKKRLKLLRKREKRKRKEANKKDPHHLTVRGNKKKHIFPNVEERIKYRLEKARIKESLLVERLAKYEVPKCQGPVVEPNILTGEERFYLKKMGQKGSNYVPVGRRGIFGGVILNMHMHWKKHETVKVFCKPCKPGQIHEYAQEIARLSGGIPIQIIGDDTIIFYRGKDYVQPKVMSPIDTLSKKKALEKSKYEQSLESVRHFIAVAEKELELYYRHIALYSNSNDHDVTPSISVLKGTLRNCKISHGSLNDSRFSNFADAECDSSNAATDGELSCSETEPKDEEC